MIKDKIYVNGRFLTQSVTGVQRYAINLLLSLDVELNNYPDLKIILLTPSSALTNKIELKNISYQRIGNFYGHFWEQVILPLFTFNRLLINLCNTSPIFKQYQYVVIHDAAVYRYPEAYRKVFVWWYRLLFFLNAKFSMSIFTVSNFSKSELIKILKIKENKIIVTSSAACITDHQDDKILDKIRVKKEKYFLMVGSLDIKKNIIKAVEAFGQLQDRDTDLVIVGGDNRSVFSGLIIPNMENIKFTGYIRDEELSSLYKNAIAFVYPSLYEGFGIPPLEAMSLNCPVIVSNSGPLPEVCGDAALYCQPECVASITNAMRNLLKIPHLRYELIGKGKIQVTKFSFVKSSKILLKKLLNDLECS